MYFAPIFLASLAISAHALATPHAAGLGRRHQHAAIAKARAPAPQPVAAPFAQPDASAATPKRKLRKRCPPRKPSLQTPAPPSAPVNVGSPISSSDTPSQPAASSPSPPPKADPKPAPKPDKPADKPAPKPSNPISLPPVLGGQSGSMFSGTQVGEGTFYGTGLGACGITNSDSDFIAAVSMHLFDNFPGYNGGNPNKNGVCGKRVRATYQGKSVEVTITDRCVGCAPGDLDFSPAAFNKIADPALGRIHPLKWEWL